MSYLLVFSLLFFDGTTASVVDSWVKFQDNKEQCEAKELALSEDLLKVIQDIEWDDRLRITTKCIPVHNTTIVDDIEI